MGWRLGAWVLPALTAVAAACLALYDMIKALDRSAVVRDIDVAKSVDCNGLCVYESGLGRLGAVSWCVVLATARDVVDVV